MEEVKIKAYIYPGPRIEYIKNFIGALRGKIDFVNQHYRSRTGLFNIVKFISKIDILFLNWPEELPEKKGGFLQTLFFFLLIHYLKLKKISIFWTLHNRESHIKGKERTKALIRRFIAKKSDYIITHAKEGLAIYEKLSVHNKPKIMFLHHPVLPHIELTYSEKKLYDILLWGTVLPYKGIDAFLDYIVQEKFDNIRILVAGKIVGNSYRNKILSYRSDNIEIQDRYITDNELELFIARSKIILFTYLKHSILSSGALMDTLRYTPLIIGPNFGAFKDLYEEGLILTYNDYYHLITYLKKADFLSPDKKKIKSFILNNSWENFGNVIYDFITSV